MRPNFVQAASSHVTQKYSRKICSKAAFQSPWHYQNRLFNVFQGLGSNPGSRGFRMERLWTLGYWANVETTPGFFFFTKYFIFFSTKKFLQIFFRRDCDRIRFQRPWSVFFLAPTFHPVETTMASKFRIRPETEKIVEIWNFSGWRQVDQKPRRSASQKKSFLRPRVVI